jgi:hypothetical protein
MTVGDTQRDVGRQDGKMFFILMPPSVIIIDRLYTFVVAISPASFAKFSKASSIKGN